MIGENKIKYAFGINLKNWVFLLFSLFLLLFMGPIALFGTIHGVIDPIVLF